MIILVVEDDLLVGHGMSRTLEEAGYCVLGPVESTSDALQAAEEWPPDLALIDIDLGRGGDGAALAEALRRRWNVPCLFISGERPMAYAARNAALGVIGKPVLPQTILACVEVARSLTEGRRPESIPAPLELFR
jgi:two-component system, response regulator PdtaR